MRERMNDRAVVDHDLLAEYDVRLDHDVLAEFGVGGEKHRLRRHQRHAGVERRVAQPLLYHGFGFGELLLGIDAAHVVLLGFDRDRVELVLARDRDRIGQIEFTFAIVVADPFQDRERMRAGKSWWSRTCAGQSLFAVAGIGFLADSRMSLSLAITSLPSPRRITRRNASTATAAPLADGARSRVSVSARMSGVSP